MKSISLQLQGSIKIERDGHELTGFGTKKARALFIFLSLERDHPHSREVLSSLFWPDQPDKLSRQSLRQALSNIKKILGAEDYLHIRPQDVEINPNVEIWSDTGEIEAIIEACGRHNHWDIEHCLPCIQRQLRILTLYNGEFLSGYSFQDSILFDEWLILRRERLHQAGLNAHTMLSHYYERRGEFDIALDHARAQIVMEPWREEAHYQAMRLYYSKDERSRALAQYKDCLRIIKVEFGANPSKETQTLAKVILDEEPLANRIKPCPQKPIIEFVGREKEKKELVEILSCWESRLITLLGTGGVGKSSLAKNIAIDQYGLYQDGIYFVPLGESHDVFSSISSALGMRSADQEIGVCDYLRDKNLLLILDNFDHLIPSAASLSKLLESAQHLQIIVTSRERLNLREERVIVLKGLPYPEDKLNDGWESCESMELFKKRIQQRDPGFEFSDNQVLAMKAICRRVEGLPLAIEMASSSIIENNETKLLESLQKGFDAGISNLRNIPERHQSLRVVFDHSWQALSPEEQGQMATLSIFRGGFSEEAALVVAGINKQVLTSLIHKSLVRMEEQGRYSLHEINREFASEKLSPDNAGWKNHALYYSQLPQNSAISSSAKVLDILDKEDANLVAAWEWSVNHDEIAFLHRLLPNLTYLFLLRGPLSEGEQLINIAIEKLGLDKEHMMLIEDLHYSLARIYLAQMRYSEMIGLVRNLPPSEKTLFAQGQALSAQGECEEARPFLEKALVLARSSSDVVLELDSLRELGNVANRLTEFETAVAYYSECLELAQKLGDLRNISAVQNNWASIDWELGDLEAAQERYIKALSIYRRLGNRLGEAKALNNLSNIMADRGEMAKSLDYCRRALAIHKDMGNIRGESAVLNNIGATLFLLKEYDSARKNYLRALELYRLSDNNQAIAETLGNLSLLDCIQGNLEEGRQMANEAIKLSDAVGDKINLANSYFYLARIEETAGNVNEAEKDLNQALELRNLVPHSARILEIKVELANIAFRKGEISLAKSLIKSVEEYTDSIDNTNDPERIMGLIATIQN